MTKGNSLVGLAVIRPLAEIKLLEQRCARRLDMHWKATVAEYQVALP